jgi:hypothetical protein
MEEAAHLGSEPKKSTFEVRGPAAALHAIPNVLSVRRHIRILTDIAKSSAAAAAAAGAQIVGRHWYHVLSMSPPWLSSRILCSRASLQRCRVCGSSPSLIALLFLADPTVEPSDNMSVIGGTPVWITLGLRDGKGPQRVIYCESSSLCS